MGKNTEGSLQILLYNTQGQKILEETRNGALDALQYLDVSAITNGVYILKLGIGDLKITSKIIIH
ncbi:MAG: T9SS type A sorting domain-containing protein [Bacteroidia bacterium]|nr:T9SS type A sorting domain-containing protein [Bacteroidia bacterium]